MVSRMTPLLVKICGLSTPDTLEAALDAGADMVGLVHVPASPRHVDRATGAALSRQAKGRARRVVLLVDPDDGTLDAVLDAFDPDMIQLHGQESPSRARAIRERAARPVLKALGIATADDLDAVAAYRDAADHLLLDAKPPRDAAYPGGHGRAFDWRLLATLDPGLPFMLSGGLAPDNVGDAIRALHAMGLTLWGVDVSSGVERAKGEKDKDRIAAFVAAARSAEAGLAARSGEMTGTST